MSAPASTPSRAPGTSRRASTWNGFELFAECLLTGVVVGVLALPLLTALPALAAGCRHLRASAEGRAAGVRILLREARTAARGSWAVSAALLAVLGVLAGNALLASSTALPGGGALRWATAALAAALLVVACRAAAAWAPGASWPRLVADAARRSAADPAGSLLVVVALGVPVLLGWMLPPLALPGAGVVVLGAVAVEARAARGS